MPHSMTAKWYYIEQFAELSMFKRAVIVPKMVKQWLNRLWDSQPTVPQPKEITGVEYYAPETAFTRGQTGQIASAEGM
jgi:hypothetical protein